MKVELKVCPFCGGKRLKETSLLDKIHAITCEDCRCLGPYRFYIAEAEEEWNKRTTKGGSDGRETSRD